MNHEFLDYKEVDVHFIYSFEWQPKNVCGALDCNFPHDIFTKELRGESRWINPQIHERLIDPIGSGGNVVAVLSSKGQKAYSSYQPTFSVNRRTLEFSGNSTTANTESYVVVPMDGEASLLPENWASLLEGVTYGEPLVPSAESAKIAVFKVAFLWTVRLFDTGCGTISVTCRVVDLDAIPDRSVRYQILHWILHLAANVDRHAESHGAGHESLEDGSEPTDSFLWLLTAAADQNFMGGASWICDSAGGNKSLRVTRLNDLAQRLITYSLGELPDVLDHGDYFGCAKQGDECAISLKVGKADNFLGQKSGFGLPHALPDEEYDYRYSRQRWDERQSPFILTSAVVAAPSMTELRSCASSMRTKEVASLLLKQTLSNSRVHTDFRYLSSEYVRHYVASTGDCHLRNMCLDERVFFSISRRAAIAITGQDDRGPSYFVIPSLLNLCEILRAQLYAAMSINCALTQLARKVGRADLDGIVNTHDQYALLQHCFLLAQQNPIIHLFDGGSITEVAKLAEEILMLNAAFEQAEKSFISMDAYMRSSSTARILKDRKK